MTPVAVSFPVGPVADVAQLVAAARDGPVLAVSPHLDDAVLSAGGVLAALAAAGLPVHVLTVFTGDGPDEPSSFAQQFHTACGLTDAGAVEHRRAEDRWALAVLGAHAEHAGLPDAIYRHGPSGWRYAAAGATFAG